MELSPDATVFWQWGGVVINATIVYTWFVMAILGFGSWLITRNLSSAPQISKWQNILEAVVTMIRDQIGNITHQKAEKFLPFIGTLFLFISISNMLSIVPVYEAPTSSLSTTAALAMCVFIAVPYFGIRAQGVMNYLKNYVQPSFIMFPFKVIAEISRTFALAVRLFGNVLSGNMVVAIILTIVPLFVPVILQALELLIGQIQAYIFAVLAMVYIASGMRRQQPEKDEGRADESG